MICKHCKGEGQVDTCFGGMQGVEQCPYCYGRRSVKTEVFEVKIPHLTKDTWLDIFTKWQRNPVYSKTIDGLQDFLEKNYKEPKLK